MWRPQLLLRMSASQTCHDMRVDSIQYHAFESPNFAPLAMLGVQLEVQQKLLLPQPRRRLKVWSQPLGMIS